MSFSRRVSRETSILLGLIKKIAHLIYEYVWYPKVVRRLRVQGDVVQHRGGRGGILGLAHPHPLVPPVEPDRGLQRAYLRDLVDLQDVAEVDLGEVEPN